MKYTLTKDQLTCFIRNNWNRQEISKEGDDEIMALFDGATNWFFELVCHTYFASQILERIYRSGENPSSWLNILFEQPYKRWLTLQEFDEDFITFLFVNARNKNISLDDNLLELQNMLNDHHYGS